MTGFLLNYYKKKNKKDGYFLIYCISKDVLI